MNKIELASSIAVLLIASILFASVFFRNSNSSEYTGGSCKIEDYKVVKIGNQIWMAENLNCYVAGSKCYNNDTANCIKYGRLYNWSTALALHSNCNSTSCANRINAPHRGICPEDWHIPSDEEWDTLYNFTGDAINKSNPYENPTAGKHLKAANGWLNFDFSDSSKTYLCEDNFDFSALPGGIGNSDGYFSNIGGYGFWWSISEYNGLNAYGRGMTYNSDYASWLNRGKNYLFSVRCLHD